MFLRFSSDADGTLFDAGPSSEKMVKGLFIYRSRHSSLHEEFQQLFPSEVLSKVLAEFSLPTPLKDHRLSKLVSFHCSLM